MSVTFPSPEPRDPSTEARLVATSLNVLDKRLSARFEVGTTAGGVFVVHRQISVTWSLDGLPDLSFTQLITDVPEVRNFRRALEQYAVSLGIFSGSVTPSAPSGP